MPPKKKARYNSAQDLTLTAAQAAAGGFRPMSLNGGEFRVASNPTLANYSSGYHEASVTTDTFIFLRGATDNKNGTHTLPGTVPKGSFFTPYGGTVVHSDNLNYVLKYADGFRTDTAQTILSAPVGLAAGHSGSGTDTTGQSAAHDLLRKKIMDILVLPPTTTKGLTERSVATLLASITVTSMAPAEIARKITGGTATLKAGDTARAQWEAKRNEAKRRVQEMFDTLTPDEKAFVHAHGDDFMDSTQSGLTPKPRRIPSLRATSPERDINGGDLTLGEVAGGGYLAGAAAATPTLALKAPPELTALTDLGPSVTEPFRGLRRPATA